jgi:ABC-type dipeptide/oligopeptide/nickel transport system ATPase component
VVLPAPPFRLPTATIVVMRKYHSSLVQFYKGAENKLTVSYYRRADQIENQVGFDLAVLLCIAGGVAPLLRYRHELSQGMRQRVAVAASSPSAVWPAMTARSTGLCK